MNNAHKLIAIGILQCGLLYPAVSTAETTVMLAQADMPAENATIKMDHMQHQSSPATTGTSAKMTASSVNGLLNASITSQIDPIVINQLHSWTMPRSV